MKDVVDSALSVKEVIQPGEKESGLTENSFNEIIGIIKGNIMDCRNGNDKPGEKCQSSRKSVALLKRFRGLPYK
ncbi:hypothetical protein [Peribacillus frigoritolerans]|nr:hypothetical protein [Peribacillus frigoritolerans]